MPLISHGGYATYYEDDGFSAPWVPSEVLLIQHGFGRNANFWWHWIPELARDYRIIRRDLRGHGGSTDSNAVPWSFDQLVEDLGDFCDALGLEKVHLLGESTGGMLSVGFAHRFPERVRTLTLCNSPTTINSAGQRFFAAGHASWQEALRIMGAEGWTRWLVQQPGTAASDTVAEREWVLQQMARTSTDAMVGYSEVISETDVAPLLPELAVPTLVLAPTRSAAAPLEEQRTMAASIPDATLAIIDSRGHEVYWDRADDCIDAWKKHVAAHAGSAQPGAATGRGG